MNIDPKKATVKDILKLATKDLLTVYNANAPEEIDRFSDHTAAFRRTKALLESLGRGMNKPTATTAEGTKKARNKVLVAPTNKPSATTEYHSVLAAFKALSLPIEKHQRFRRQLKAEGKATFGDFVFTATY